MRNPMFVYDDHLTDLVFEYCRHRLELDPVPLDYGGTRTSLGTLLEGAIERVPHDPSHVLAIFDTLAKSVVSCDSPRFLSFIPAAPTKAALLFDMIVSSSSLQGTSWLEAAGAVAAENQALAVLAELAGLPSSSGGCFVSGGSTGNLSALVVARDTAPRRVRRSIRHPLIAVGEEAHSSVSMALHIIGVDPLLVPTVDHRLTGEALRAALAPLRRDHDDVIGVVATAGTTNAGIIDDLAGVAEVAHQERLWFHVDAAYGGAGLLAPSVRQRFAGIERADSLIVDPHKWLFAPFDCAALLYRDPRLAKAVHTQDAAYLEILQQSVGRSTGPGSGSDPGSDAGTGSGSESGSADQPRGERDGGPWNPSDYAIHLTRRARGLPLWFSLAVHGLDAYRDAVEAVLETARRSTDLIRRRPYLSLVREPELSVVLFSRNRWQWADYERWSTNLLADQIGFVTPTTWQGEPVARFAFLHPDTSLAMVEEILDTMA